VERVLARSSGRVLVRVRGCTRSILSLEWGARVATAQCRVHTRQYTLHSARNSLLAAHCTAHWIKGRAGELRAPLVRGPSAPLVAVGWRASQPDARPARPTQAGPTTTTGGRLARTAARA